MISKIKNHQQTIILIIGYCLVFAISFTLGKASAQQVVPPEIKIEEVFSPLHDTQNLPLTQSKNEPILPAENNGECSGKIKGNISSSGNKIYHMPDGSFYKRTTAEQCFDT